MAQAANFAEPVAGLYKWCRVIDQNLVFIQQELPTLSVPEDVRSEISATCRGFQDVQHDVLAEIRILEDKLGLHPGEEPNGPNAVNSDPRVSIELIEGWLSKEAETLNRLVRKLWELDEREHHAIVLASTLVTESAANILQAWAGIKEDSRIISGRLGSQG
jgi:hypothetical protein